MKIVAPQRAQRSLSIAAAAALCAAALAAPPAEDTPAPAEVAAPAAAEPAEVVPEAGTSGTRLQGTAYLGRNRQVVGATITVVDEADPSVIFLTATDEKGRFRIGELPNGGYRVEVRREGLVPVVKTGVELRFPFRAILEVPMQPVDPTQPASAVGAEDTAPGAAAAGRVSLHGAARGLDGERLSEVRVRLVSGGADEDPRDVVTASDGTFALDDLPAGPWKLEARGVGFLPLRTALDLRDATDLRCFMVRQPSGYDPSPLDLMPEEEPIPPAGLGPQWTAK